MTIETLLRNHPALATCQDSVESARDLLIDTYREGGKLLLCGNGGSAADCDHIAGELLKGFRSHRPLSEEDCLALAESLPDGEADPDLYLLAGQLQGGLPAVSLPAQTAALTAVCNDTDPALIFAQLTWALGQSGDTLICLSTSGNSRNVVRDFVDKILNSNTNIISSEISGRTDKVNTELFKYENSVKVWG